uniref:Uncharacterized protein n=1 Tax=Anguilla anguilla TaxID=7936 RepID=A0A0E9PA74_ANGAN
MVRLQKTFVNPGKGHKITFSDSSFFIKERLPTEFDFNTQNFYNECDQKQQR